MRHIAAASCAAVVACVVPGLSAADPLNYDEAQHGDLPAEATTLLTLDVGQNSIRGTQSTAFGFASDFDSFSVMVLPGATLTSVTITLEDVSGDVLLASWTFGGAGGSIGEIGGPSPGTHQMSGLSLGSGTYAMNSHYVQIEPEAASLSYRFDIQVSAVPELGTASLAWAGVGMLGLMVLARRRGRTQWLP